MKEAFVIRVVSACLVDLLIANITITNRNFRNTSSMVHKLLKSSVLSSNIFITAFTLQAVSMGKPFISELNELFSLLHQLETKRANVFSMLRAFRIFDWSVSITTDVITILLIADSYILEDKRNKLFLVFLIAFCCLDDIQFLLIDSVIELASSSYEQFDEVSFHFDQRGLLWI